MKTLFRFLLISLLPSAVLAAPTVSLTAPTAGNVYLAPATFAVKANASASGVGINRVEFYANGTLIQTDTTNPYQFDWSGVAAGSYSITAVAYDNNGASTTSAAKSVTVAGTNTAPTVSLSTPADNSRYLNPSGIAISANAAGPELNDIIQSVAFYLNGSLSQTVTFAPFSYNATGLAAGTYTLTAVATDSQGAQTTSAARTFTVSATNVPPTVSLVIPQDNTQWNAPATVTFQASVNSGEANDTVSVEFFANGVSQGVRSSSPFSLTQSLTAGTYTITAVATDGQSAQTTSAARTITVSDTNNPPTVSITSPTANANYPTPPVSSISITTSSTAGEINGSLTKVEFYANGTLIGTKTSGPWNFTWTNVAAGAYSLTAKAFDNFNATTTSAAVNISVGAQPGQLFFVHTDHLNTPRAIYDGAQQARWKWDQQEPFGVNVPDENPAGQGAFEFPQRFPGQYADKETSLAYNYFRDYDAVTGRYSESDPLGLPGGINTYLYATATPLGASDPLGLVPNPAEVACVLGPNPVCVSGVVADVVSSAAGLAIGTGIIVAVTPTAGPAPASSSTPGQVANPSDNAANDDCPDDSFCKRRQESLQNQRALMLMMEKSGWKMRPSQVRDFNAQVRAHNKKCPKFPVDPWPWGPKIVK